MEAKYPDLDLKEIFIDPQHSFLPGVAVFGRGLVQRHMEAKYPDPDMKETFRDPQRCFLPGVAAFH